MTKIKPLALLSALLLIGAALRFWFAWTWYGHYEPRADHDEGYYESGIGLLSAHAFSTGIPATVPRSWRGPIYPSFIALVESPFSRPSPGHVRLAQAALSSVSVGLVFVLAQAAASPAAGLAAAGWLALHPAQIALVSSLNIDGFYSFWILVVALAVLVWIRRGGDDASSAALGLALGASLLCRSSHYLLVPLLAVAAPLWWGRRLKAARAAALFLAATVLALAPMIARNALQFREFIPLPDRNAGAVVFFAGAMGEGSNCSLERALELAETFSPGFKSRGLSEEALHSAFFHLALRRILDDPLRYARRCLANAFAIWAPLWLYALLAACALVLAPGRFAVAGLGLVAASFCGYAVGGGTAEHMAAAVPLLCALGGIALASALTRLGLRMPAALAKPVAAPRAFSFAVLAVAAAMYAAMTVFIALESREWRRTTASERAPDARELEVLRLAASSGDQESQAAYAAALFQSGDAAKAAVATRAARSGSAKAGLPELFQRAELFRRRKEYGRALRVAREILDRDRGNPGFWIGLADAERDAGRRKEAVFALDEVVRRSPPPETLRAVAIRYQDLGSMTKASALLETLRKSQPSRPDLAVDAAVARFRSGDPSGAVRILRETSAAAPGYVPAALNLAAILKGQGKIAEASAVCENALSRVSAGDPMRAQLREACANSSR
ncbi:MAG: tetratricopeptide repeat protein [Elusimicrobia bacterium]|nr:tetratricopeptide repeat protein [Elusimicrobiota bacterium]